MFLLSCSGRSIEDYREQITAIEQQLVQEFAHIHVKSDLVAIAPKIRKLFTDLGAVLKLAEEYHKKNPAHELPEISAHQIEVNQQLRLQMHRIYMIDGCRELVEACQEDALRKL